MILEDKQDNSDEPTEFEPDYNYTARLFQNAEISLETMQKKVRAMVEYFEKAFGKESELAKLAAMGERIYFRNQILLKQEEKPNLPDKEIMKIFAKQSLKVLEGKIAKEIEKAAKEAGANPAIKQAIMEILKGGLQKIEEIMWIIENRI